MSKMEYLEPLEAEKFKKQKWKQIWWTPCIMTLLEIFPSVVFVLLVTVWIRWAGYHSMYLNALY